MPGSSTLRTHWTDVMLSNSSSRCYANASVISLCHVWGVTQVVPEVFQLLYTMLRTRANLGIAVSLCTQPLLRRLMPVWEFNDRQQDAVEFLMILLQSDPESRSLWCSREDELGFIRTLDHGIIISLTLPDSETQLQELVDAWHEQRSIHALTEEHSVVLLQLGRYRDGRKVTSRVFFGDDVALPCFNEGLRCVWVIYRPVAAIVHLGSRASEGHYRAVLRSGEPWVFTDDNSAVPCDIGELHNRNVYMLWVARPAALR